MITVDPGTHIIMVPQSYLTFVSGISWTLDTNQLRLDLRDWEDSELGVVMPKTHIHKTKSLLSGVTYARIFEILAPYQVEFEDTGSHYTVICQGTNHNLADVMVQNAVNLIIGNSAGLIEVETGGGTGGTDPASVWGHTLSTGNSADKELTDARIAAQNSEIAAGDAEIAADAAKVSADAAQVSASAAKTSADTAASKADQAKASADLAKDEATLAKNEATAAKNQAVTNYAAITAIDQPDNAGITKLLQAHFNRRYWNKVGKTITIYDTDKVTPLYTFDTNDDLSDISPQ